MVYPNHSSYARMEATEKWVLRIPMCYATYQRWRAQTWTYSNLSWVQKYLQGFPDYY